MSKCSFPDKAALTVGEAGGMESHPPHALYRFTRRVEQNYDIRVTYEYKVVDKNVYPTDPLGFITRERGYRYKGGVFMGVVFYLKYY